MAGSPLIDGAAVRLGARDFVVPALTIRLFRRHRATLAGVSALGQRDPTDEEWDALLALVHDALLRNHPDLTRDELEDLLDLRNIGDVMAAITGRSGLTARGGGQPGEGQAVSPSTGTS